MQEGTSHIQVMATVEEEDNPQVRDKTNAGYNKHEPALNRGRVNCPLVCLPQDAGTHADQQKGVDEGREDLTPVVSVGPLLCGKLKGKGHCPEGKNEREDIAEHVSCIADEGKRSGEQSSDDFNEQENNGDEECDLHGFPVIRNGLGGHSICSICMIECLHPYPPAMGGKSAITSPSSRGVSSPARK